MSKTAILAGFRASAAGMWVALHPGPNTGGPPDGGPPQWILDTRSGESMGKIIGIDLGTTNSVVAVMEGGE
ncbi:MAG: Hsp70 family protein, partial [Gemmatimonadetes bacterium]|nr:Hsp70 family protein [Gemmatimonadota bacterium]